MLRRLYRLPSIFLVGVIAGSCAGPTETTQLKVPGGLFAKVASGPAVTAALPSSAPADTTLDVAITGSGFATGATATMQLNGAADPRVKTNSTRFVSSTQLSANVTIARDAIQTLYDVAVTLASGKKGIGTELFTVKAPTGNGVASVEVIPSAAGFDAGSSFQLSARTRTKTGNIVTGRVVTWSSSDVTIATVSANGLATGTAPGSATITATSEGVSGTASVTVRTPSTLSPLASVTAGDQNFCALNTSGAAFCWGYGDVGQLGNGVLANVSTPVEVAGGLSFAAISPAIYHGCGLAADGTAYCWGRNDQGALGDGTLVNHYTPAPVSGGLHFTKIKTGMHFTCGLVASGDAYCWGQGQFGVLGNGTLGVSTAPVLVSGGHIFTELGTGLWQACAIDNAGAAWCWGDNRAFGLGDGTAINSSIPVRVIGGVTFSTVSGGENYTCALTPAGAAYCWGYDYFGSLGDGLSGSGTSRGTPKPVIGGFTFRALTTGGAHACGLLNDGTVRCWGDNVAGQFGNGTLVSTTSPVNAASGFSWSSIAATYRGTCGITSANVAYCWGAGARGQLGNGATTDSSLPVKVNGQP
ncbi:MAG TPA: Ig-like domain-containing protein [Gemmatimonadaceae bacterium]